MSSYSDSLMSEKEELLSDSVSGSVSKAQTTGHTESPYLDLSDSTEEGEEVEAREQAEFKLLEGCAARANLMEKERGRLHNEANR